MTDFKPFMIVRMYPYNFYMVLKDSRTNGTDWYTISVNELLISADVHFTEIISDVFVLPEESK